MLAKLGHFHPGQCPEGAAFVGDLNPCSLSIGIPADPAQEAGSVGDETRARPACLKAIRRSRPPESVAA